MFANGLGDQDSIPGRVIPKTQKMVLDAFLLNIQHYKVQIKGKGVAPSPTLWRIKKGAVRSPSTTVANFTSLLILLNSPTVYIYIYKQ